MKAHRDKIIGWIDEYLDVKSFDDHCPNGLQVQGVSEISQIVIGVSASLALFESCHKQGGQMVITHHGLIWKGTSSVVRGVFRDRLAFLLRNGLNLLAYHLPLDAHPEMGNNVLLARKLGLHRLEAFGHHGGKPIGWHGHLPQEMALQAVIERIESVLGTQVVHLDTGKERINRVGVISGGAAGDVADAIDLGLDLFLTGETAEPTYHICAEAGMNFVAGGHYRTERLGIQALGDKIQEKFGIPVTFCEVTSPV